MVSKSQLKLITSLHQKKFRTAEQLFLAEGVKVIDELLHAGFVLEHLYFTQGEFRTVPNHKKTAVSQAELKKMSALTTANNCLAVFEIPIDKPIEEKGLIVALDDIRDPGNLGTIIRLCDWFGIKELLCSRETAELYNPKVVQATMGSMARVNVSYVDLEKFLVNTRLPVFGTFMDGKNIYKETLPLEGIIVFGNEANGISKPIESICKNQIAIPRFGELQKTESLNVASAAAIVLSEFRR